MKSMTIKAEVNGVLYGNRFDLTNFTADEARLAWLEELRKTAGEPDEGTVQVAVSSIGDDAEDNIERGRD